MDISNEHLNEIEADLHICRICDLKCSTENSLRYHRTKFHMAPDITDATQTIEIHLPPDSFITGQYIAKFKIEKDFKGIDTPDGSNVVHIESDGLNDRYIVWLKNPNDIDYSFHLTTIYRGKEVHLARAIYDSDERCLRINNQWIISENSIENVYKGAVTSERGEPNELLKIELNEKYFENPTLSLFPKLSLSNLVSIGVNAGPICKIGFNRNKLAFVSYDGYYPMDRQ